MTEPLPTTPRRIQLRREKGWQKPPDAVVVARPTKWGNPFTTADAGSRAASVVAFRTRLLGPPEVRHYPSDEEIRAELAGRDLCCWCRPDQPCHADVLLEIANS